MRARTHAHTQAHGDRIEKGSLFLRKRFVALARAGGARGPSPYTPCTVYYPRPKKHFVKSREGGGARQWSTLYPELAWRARNSRSRGERALARIQRCALGLRHRRRRHHHDRAVLFSPETAALLLREYLAVESPTMCRRARARSSLCDFSANAGERDRKGDCAQERAFDPLSAALSFSRARSERLFCEGTMGTGGD